MFGCEGRKDVLLVPVTTRVRDVMELLIELDAASVARSLKPRKLLESTCSISATSAMSPAASRSARQMRTHVASASRLSISGAHWSRRCHGAGVGLLPLQMDSR